MIIFAGFIKIMQWFIQHFGNKTDSQTVSNIVHYLVADDKRFYETAACLCPDTYLKIKVSLREVLVQCW